MVKQLGRAGERMKAVQLVKAFPAIFIFGLLGGCGLRVPEIAEIWDGPDATKQIEFEIRRKIYCELKGAAHEITKYRVEREEPNGVKSTNPLLPDDWVAQITLQLQVDESSAVNPGVAFNTPMHNAITNFRGEFLAPSGSGLSRATFPFVSTSQLYSLGLGGTLSSTGTRIDRINAYWTVGYLKPKPTNGSVCDPLNPGRDPYLKHPGDLPSSSSPFLLQSELGIKQWLVDSLENEKLLPSNEMRSSGTSSSGGKSGGTDSKSPDELQQEIKFIIVSSGNITPTWKLVRVSANTGNLPLFSSGRTRTHDLLVTIGPRKDTSLNQSGQIGQAVSSGLRPQLQELLQPLL